eukprot:6465138-Amphidinium_carterae.1
MVAKVASAALPLHSDHVSECFFLHGRFGTATEVWQDLPLWPDEQGRLVTKRAMAATIAVAAKKGGLPMAGAQILARTDMEVSLILLFDRWDPTHCFGTYGKPPCPLRTEASQTLQESSVSTVYRAPVGARYSQMFVVERSKDWQCCCMHLAAVGIALMRSQCTALHLWHVCHGRVGAECRAQG